MVSRLSLNTVQLSNMGDSNKSEALIQTPDNRALIEKTLTKRDPQFTEPFELWPKLLVQGLVALRWNPFIILMDSPFEGAVTMAHYNSCLAAQGTYYPLGNCTYQPLIMRTTLLKELISGS